MRLADEIRKILQYQTKRKLINEQEIERQMKIWITELEKQDVIIRRN